MDLADITTRLVERAKVAATPNQLERIKREYERYAKESLEIEEIGGAVYAFGSELAVLRLYHKFRGSGRAMFSSNTQRWFFTPNG